MIGMNPILFRSSMCLGVVLSLPFFGSCNSEKPTSGSNNSEYRDGKSGATPETMRKEGPGTQEK